MKCLRIACNETHKHQLAYPTHHNRNLEAPAPERHVALWKKLPIHTNRLLEIESRGSDRALKPKLHAGMIMTLSSLKNSEPYYFSIFQQFKVNPKMNNASKVVLGMVAAAAAGAAIGMLLAPEKGTDLQKRIKEEANNWIANLNNLLKTGKVIMGDVRTATEQTIQSLQSELSDPGQS